MNIGGFLLGFSLITVVLIDAFETIVLPRTVSRNLRITHIFFWFSRHGLRAVARLKPGVLRQTLLGSFAPVNLLSLMVCWALLIIAGFAFLDWSISALPIRGQSFGSYLYFSGVTFFTLGYGDLVPVAGVGRTLAVAETGIGFGFLALVIGYVPVIYAAFSRREVTIVLLDSKAGSEPTAGELLRRHAEAGRLIDLVDLLKNWERFAAELLESYLSYPVLAYYRSQHDHQSWLTSLTAIMDTCALLHAGFEGDPEWEAALAFQANATFAMARHVVVDLAYVIGADPVEPVTDRLSESELGFLSKELAENGCELCLGPEGRGRLNEYRDLYEPHVAGLAAALVVELPRWIPAERLPDNWQVSAWDKREHFQVGEIGR